MPKSILIFSDGTGQVVGSRAGVETKENVEPTFIGILNAVAVLSSASATLLSTLGLALLIVVTAVSPLDMRLATALILLMAAYWVPACLKVQIKIFFTCPQRRQAFWSPMSWLGTARHGQVTCCLPKHPNRFVEQETQYPRQPSAIDKRRRVFRRLHLPRLAIRGGFLVVAATALAGCQDGEQNYLTNGIGSELTAPGLVRTESLQNQYFSYLCRQATSQSYAPNASCQVDSWNLIVQQGMNDIDRRCDAYLQWLDNRKRSKGPWISQIGDTAAATSAILGQVNAGTKAITIVGQAFQLLTKSVENYHSRLLLEIESSTINSIVLRGRYDFRSYIQEQRLKFASKPDAEHALRSYTRLCLPFAIEAKVNDFSTMGAQGEMPRAGGSFGDLPVVGTITSNTTVFKPDRGQGRGNPTTSIRIAEAIQKALCVPADGKVGPRTVEGIRAYQYTQKQAETGELSANVESAIMNTFGASQPKPFAECDPQFSNFLERSIFQNDPANAEALAQLRDDLSALAKKHGVTVEISDADTLTMLRPKIAEIKRKIGGDAFRSGDKAFLNTEFTPDLERMLN
ncbi:hypothetical protein P6U16_25895 (plasmid) [Rhizobium sp. 32-5/1]|uniref:hypothetical protein n=1 Tax=Rhizobium sp. 32-5/1 TaxID=3019602 RepID=UPI00240E0E15|nr:hypothetical protein [Rhizobium sp. 32-5/1]WEZ85503.1 hypothetical protein P6U16_25895 [Rhizobium sp. 32-5/1]